MTHYLAEIERLSDEKQATTALIASQAADIERLKADRERLDSILCGCVTIHRSPSGNFTARGVGGNFVHGTVAHESDADYLVACKAAIDESMGQQP